MIQSNRDLLDISPVRHSNRRYSSIVKNRDLLHNILWYLSLRTRTSDASQLEKKINRKDREERKGVLYSDSRSPCVKPEQAPIAFICCGQYIWLLVYRDMAS